MVLPALFAMRGPVQVLEGASENGRSAGACVLYRQTAPKGEARFMATNPDLLRGCLEAQHPGVLSRAAALLVDIGRKFGSRARDHLLSSGLQPLLDLGIGERLADVGGDALAQIVRHVARAIEADQPVERQAGKASLDRGRHARDPWPWRGGGGG